jgi:hypothetical protein
MSIGNAALLTVFACGAVMQMLVGCFYGTVIHDARYGTCSSEFIKRIRQRFDDYARLGMKPENVGQYVERELENYDFCGLPMHMWHRMTKSVGYLGMVLGLVLSLWIAQDASESLLTLGVTFVGGFVLGIVGEVFGCMDGRQRAVVSVAYHLEYSLAHRDNMREAVAIDFQRMKEKMEEIEESLTYH